MKRKLYTTFAAIHLGSEMISMQITEYRSIDRVKVAATDVFVLVRQPLKIK